MTTDAVARAFLDNIVLHLNGNVRQWIFSSLRRP